jgi:hypothetical protein
MVIRPIQDWEDGEKIGRLKHIIPRKIVAKCLVISIAQ